jgi:agmatinase
MPDDAQRFDEDSEFIPLDRDDPSFGMWKQQRDASGDPKREPGPIRLQRFDSGLPYVGIPTFFKLPVALNPADLKAGKVEVAILGAPVDMGYSMRGAAWGPQAVRTSERSLPYGPALGPHVHVNVNPFQELTVVDYGDGPVEPFSADRTAPAMRKFVREVVDAGAIPIVVGGDHSLMWPDAAAMQDVYGRGKVGVIHFDAHYDAAENAMGHATSHGRPVRNLILKDKFPGKNFVQIGLRGYMPDVESQKWMDQQGIRSHYMAEVEKDGWDALMKRALAEALDGPEVLFISLDVDVFDPSFVPGTGTPEPNGLTPREVFPLIRRLCAEHKVVGIEVVELLPYLDPTYRSALMANRCIREMLTGLAMYKKGMRDPHYLDPFTSGTDKMPKITVTGSTTK